MVKVNRMKRDHGSMKEGFGDKKRDTIKMSPKIN